MNKKLIAIAMGLAMAGGMSLASAEVKLYGQIDLSIDAIDQDGGVDDVNMGSNTSAVGVKGSEELGNGLNAIFQLEWQVDVDDADVANSGYESESGSGFAGRDQWIGLKGDSWGQLTFGTMSTVYKSGSVAIDPFYRTRNEARQIGLQSSLHSGKGEEGQGRATNTVRYDSPSWGGFGLAGTYTLDNNENDVPVEEDDDPFSVGVNYKGGPIYAAASYITTSGGGDDDAVQFAIKGMFGDFAVWGNYEMDGGLITLNQYGSADPGQPNAGSGDGADIWSVGASYTIGNNLIAVDYGQGDEADDPTVLDDDYTVWRVGAKHSFSKRTMVYITHANVDAEDGGEADLTSLGMRHNF